MILILKWLNSYFLIEKFLAPYPLVYIFFSLFCLRESGTNNRNQILTANLLKQEYLYHAIRETFYKFYHRHSELIVKDNTVLKTRLHQGKFEPVFYNDLC